MFKNINWKKIGIWALNAILALIGGAGAGYVATQEEPAVNEAPVAYEAPVSEIQGWDSDYNYRLTAVFAKKSKVKAGNFPDAEVEEDGLGVYTLYVSKPDLPSAAKAYAEITGYKNVKALRILQVEKRPGYNPPEDNAPDEK